MNQFNQSLFKRSNGACRRFRSVAARPRIQKARAKPRFTVEQLRAVVHAVFTEADDDGNGDLDINEGRTFCRKLMAQTYPDKPWDEERYRQGFYGIDRDSGGSIDFEELFKHIERNAARQGMLLGAASP